MGDLTGAAAECKGQNDEVGADEAKCPVELVLTVWRKQEWNKIPTASDANVQQGGTIGDFELRKTGDKDPLVTGKMLEAAGPSSKVRDSDARVMPGTYKLIKNPGSKGPYRITQETQAEATSQFGTRGAVNIHGGNNPVDLEGCLLPGGASTVNAVKVPGVGGAKATTQHYPSISSSQPKLKEIKEQIAKYGVTESKTTYDGMEKYTTTTYTNVKVVIFEIVNPPK